MDDRLFTTPEGRARLEGELLPRWLPTCRWFGGKARVLRGLKIAASERLGGAWLLAVAAEYADGSETYAVPLALSRDSVEGVVAEENGARLFDATHSPEFRAALFRVMADATPGPLRGERGGVFASLFPDGATPESRVLKAEQSNTSLIYGEKLFVKLYRKLVPGENPDAEMTRFLSERAGFKHVPAFGGAVEWNGASLALATNVVANECDAWTLALASRGDPAEESVRTIWGDRAELLGYRTGEMHRALMLVDAPGFEPEPFTADDVCELADSIGRLTGEVLAQLYGALDYLPPKSAALAMDLLANAPPGSFGHPPPGDLGVKCRCHGDFHLGQVVLSGSDFTILDFEGEPSRTLAERRAKRSPLRDVAGMLRSFHYAACAGAGVMERWCEFSSGMFRWGWDRATRGCPTSLDAPYSEPLLRLFMREKALYETLYELNNRPDWLHIPLRGLLSLI